MDADLYAMVASETANPKAHQWEHYVLGMVDEVGEVAKIFKKIVAYQEIVDVDHEILNGVGKDGVPMRDRLIEELGDLHWFMSQLCRLYGIEISEVLKANIRKLQGARYKNGFTTQEALDRDLVAEAEELQAVPAKEDADEA